MLMVALGESTMSRTQVQLQYKRFNDDAHSGHPSMSTTYENIEAAKKIILYNRLITIRKVADDLGISFGSCQAIFTDVIGMKRAVAKIVPIVDDV